MTAQTQCLILLRCRPVLQEPVTWMRHIRPMALLAALLRMARLTGCAVRLRLNGMEPQPVSVVRRRLLISMAFQTEARCMASLATRCRRYGLAAVGSKPCRILMRCRYFSLVASDAEALLMTCLAGARCLLCLGGMELQPSLWMSLVALMAV